MKRIEHDYGVDYYPFADADEPDERTAARGRVTVYDKKYAASFDAIARPHDDRLTDRVRFSVNLTTLTRAEWEQFKGCVEMAFDEMEGKEPKQ